MQLFIASNPVQYQNPESGDMQTPPRIAHCEPLEFYMSNENRAGQ
jgi:hypothetical protein